MMPRLAIGLGCRRGCPAEAVLAVIQQACATRDIAAARLFSIESKRDESGMLEAAEVLGLPLAFLSSEALAAVAERVTHRSCRVEAATGVPSVAEAAALVGAGPGSRLIVPRVAHPLATCAVAVEVNA